MPLFIKNSTLCKYLFNIRQLIHDYLLGKCIQYAKKSNFPNFREQTNFVLKVFEDYLKICSPLSIV